MGSPVKLSPEYEAEKRTLEEVCLAVGESHDFSVSASCDQRYEVLAPPMENAYIFRDVNMLVATAELKFRYDVQNSQIVPTSVSLRIYERTQGCFDNNQNIDTFAKAFEGHYSNDFDDGTASKLHCEISIVKERKLE